MRIFIYKTLFIFVCSVIVYKLTIGDLVQKFELKIEEIYSKKNIDKTKQKIRKEIESSINNERILDKEHQR